MDQTDWSIVQRMNIHSDALIINQADRFSCERKQMDGHEIIMMSFAERGVGLSRNTAMMRSNAEIIEFADDDMIFESSHEADVLSEFDRHPEADAILFSLESLNSERPLLRIDSFSKVSRREALKYGCARLAVRREKMLYNNLSFSLLFGGGCRYGSGEDTILLQRMLDAGLKIYKSPVKVADVRQDGSSWFDGYTEQYYKNKGALFAAALPRTCRLYAALSAIKTKDRGNVYRWYNEGIREFRNRSKGTK